MMKKEEIIRKRLSVPRVIPQKFKEWEEENKKSFLLHMAQIFDLSDPSQFFEMDVSKLDDEKLMFLNILGLNVTRTGNKCFDLFPHIAPYFQRERPKPSISNRERELCIIRTGWLCRADYECIQHIFNGLINEFTAEEIVRIFIGSEAPDWSSTEALILRATDELHENYFICDDTWNKLSETYNEKQILELIITVGHYTKLAMFLNSTGVQVENQHQGFGKLSEKINNLPNYKNFLELLNLIKKIYNDEIVREEFNDAMIALKLFVQKDEFKIIKSGAEQQKEA